MTDNEKLIEEAAKAIGQVREVVIPRGDGYVSVTDADDATLARAALAVFEKAHTPTDDEIAAERDRRYPELTGTFGEYLDGVRLDREQTFGHDGKRDGFLEGAKWAAALLRSEELSTEHQKHADARRDETMTLISHIPSDDEREALARRAIRAADEADECGDPVIEAWSDGERFTADDLRTLAAGFRRSEVPEPSRATRITIEHEGGNTVTGTLEEVLNHGHLKPGWRYREAEPQAEPSKPMNAREKAAAMREGKAVMDGYGKPLTRNARGEWVNEIGDTPCPNDGEMTNRACWKCGWARAEGAMR